MKKLLGLLLLGMAVLAVGCGNTATTSESPATSPAASAATSPAASAATSPAASATTAQ